MPRRAGSQISGLIAPHALGRVDVDQPPGGFAAPPPQASYPNHAPSLPPHSAIYTAPQSHSPSPPSYAPPHTPPVNRNSQPLVLITGISKVCEGISVPLQEGTFTIGRSSSSTITISDHSLSRTHVTLVVSYDGRTTIRDLESSNGTTLNGHQIMQADLRHDDVFRTGEASFRFTQVNPLNYDMPRRVIGPENQPIEIDDSDEIKVVSRLEPLRLVLIASVVLSLVVLIIVAVLVISVRNEDASRHMRSEASMIYLEGVEFMREANWDRAESLFRRASELDPTIQGVSEQLDRLEVERGHEKQLDNAKDLMRKGKVQLARDAAEKIPRESIYYERAHDLLLSLEE